MNALIVASLLLLASAVLLLSLVIRRHMAMRHIVERLGGDGSISALETLTNSAVLSNSKFFDNEAIGFLNQLGWRSARHRTRFLAIQLAVPILLTVLAAVVQTWMGDSAESGSNMFWIVLLFVFGIGYLIPKRYISKAAKNRQEQLSIEVSTMIPLLRMLFEVGMTVEQALRVLMQGGKKILPELTRELTYILQRVDAGLELGAELRESAFLLQVEDLTDVFTILEQLIHQGGGGMSSLLSLKELLDERRITALQEKVSKMSAKMSIVMMLFLFPALLIVLAGPGFLAIIQALGDMG
ncbi:MAG TPA: type II secretion system F family protein [Thiopseudomonas sp.]|nr:type II secretion system F family protein [Thiopseudomonas sp.]